MAYAANTSISFDRSIGEIVGMLKKVGAERIAQFEEPSAFTIQFVLAERIIKFSVALPQSSEMPARDGRNSPLSSGKRWQISAPAKRGAR